MLRFLITVFCICVLFSCSENTQPKAYGNLRLEYAKPEFQKFTDNCPFVFEYSKFANLSPSKNDCWYNLRYKNMKAHVYFTYYPVQNNLSLHTKEVEKMVYEHTIRANSIDTKFFNFPEKKVFGNVYVLNGQTASNLQFYITDSTKNFVTGSLYFKTRPKPDSLAPAIEYIKNDIVHLIETFEWKK